MILWDLKEISFKERKLKCLYKNCYAITLLTLTRQWQKIHYHPLPEPDSDKPDLRTLAKWIFVPEMIRFLWPETNHWSPKTVETQPWSWKWDHDTKGVWSKKWHIWLVPNPVRLCCSTLRTIRWFCCNLRLWRIHLEKKRNRQIDRQEVLIKMFHLIQLCINKFHRL